MKIIEKAAELLNGCAEFVLTSINEDGYPRASVVSNVQSDGVKKAWCATGLSSKKTKNFMKNPKASLCFWQNGNSVSLVGTVAVKTDTQTKEALWQDWFVEHFPGGATDPDYCVLEFSAKEATLWIDGEFVTVEGDAL